jgi:hypothetical protein
MKKFLLFLLLAVASTPAAFAQARAGGELSSKDYTGGGTTDSRNTGFGVKGGYNLSNAYGDGTKSHDFSTANTFHAGVYGQFGFNEFSSVQVELLYSRKGFTGTTGSSTTPTSTSSMDTRLDYLELPILYVGNITETISFHLGPQISLLTKVKEGDKDIALADNGYNSVDYGAVGGLEARLGPARIGARYDLAFGKIYDESDAKIIARNIKDRVSNGTFQVYVGIGITQ